MQAFLNMENATRKIKSKQGMVLKNGESHLALACAARWHKERDDGGVLLLEVV